MGTVDITDASQKGVQHQLDSMGVHAFDWECSPTSKAQLLDAIVEYTRLLLQSDNDGLRGGKLYALLLIVERLQKQAQELGVSKAQLELIIEIAVRDRGPNDKAVMGSDQRSCLNATKIGS